MIWCVGGVGMRRGRDGCCGIVVPHSVVGFCDENEAL